MVMITQTYQEEKLMGDRELNIHKTIHFTTEEYEDSFDKDYSVSYDSYMICSGSLCFCRFDSLKKSKKIDGLPIRKLFVSNLADGTAYRDLRKFFSKYGDIERCYLCRNYGKRANCAFITFSKVTEAMKAWSDCKENGRRLNNRELRVLVADSWHQPDSAENKSYNKGKESNKTSKRKVNKHCAQECLQNDNVSIHILNDDCLRHIFLFLPILDRIRIERVCQRWRILSQDTWCKMQTLDVENFVWSKMRISNMSTGKLRKILLKCGRFLKEIIICDQVHCLTESTLTMIAKLCPNLESIDVRGVPTCPSGIQALAKNCRNITKYRLGRLLTDSCDNGLKDLFKMNRNLEYLAIRQTKILIKSLLWLPAQNVHTIILEECYCIEDYHFSIALKKLENLRHLTIDRCEKIGKHTLEVVSKHCENLRVLELDTISEVQREDMLYLTCLTNLQVLKIRKNCEIDDEFITNLVRQCQQLTSIRISHCPYVTDIGLAAIATLPKLEALHINYLDITDSGLQNLCNLKELCCLACWGITDQAIIMLIKSSPELQLLDVSCCKNITKAAYEAVKDAWESQTIKSNKMIFKMSQVLKLP